MLNIDELEQDHIEAQRSKTIVHVVSKVRILVFHPLNGWMPGMPWLRCVEVEAKSVRKHLIDPEVDKGLRDTHGNSCGSCCTNVSSQKEPDCTYIYLF